MKNTNLFKLSLVLIIAGLLYIRYINRDIPDTPLDQSPTPTASESPKPSIDTTTFNTPYFSLEHPSVATASVTPSGPDSQDWKIIYMGQKQQEAGRTETELFDGYALTITRYEVVGSDPALVQATADREAIVSGCGEDSADPIMAGSISGFDTLTFYGGCLGESTYHYFMQGDALYRTTHMIVGEEEDLEGYQTQVDYIYSTLQFK